MSDSPFMVKRNNAVKRTWAHDDEQPQQQHPAKHVNFEQEAPQITNLRKALFQVNASTGGPSTRSQQQRAGPAPTRSQQQQQQQQQQRPKQQQQQRSYQQVQDEDEDDLYDESMDGQASSSSAASAAAAPAKGKAVHVEVFLRLLPLPGSEPLCLTIKDDTTVKISQPVPTGIQKIKASGNNVKADMEFSFSHVFSPAATQMLFYVATTLPLVRDALAGRPVCLFAYGVTSSGKTYTMTGKDQEWGLLPRTLDTIFLSIEGLHADSLFRPYGLRGVRAYTEEEAYDVESRHLLERPLASNSNEDEFNMPDSKSNPTQFSARAFLSRNKGKGKEKAVFDEEDLVDASKLDDEDFEIPGIADNEPVDVDKNYRYIIWISAAQLINEIIQDLLVDEPTEEDKRFNRKKPTLSVGEGHIKNLTEVRVSSLKEALKIIHRARKNRKVRATNLNKSSSRSHAIFTIKIIKVRFENGYLLEGNDNIHISAITIADLAGSERADRTNARGEAITEAGAINKSLLTLHQVLEKLHASQHSGKPSLIPYRESHLTWLLKPYFEGAGRAVMIVNVNPSSNQYGETLNVLELSAKAKAVTSKAQIEAKIDTGLKEARRRKLVVQPPVPQHQPIQQHKKSGTFKFDHGGFASSSAEAGEDYYDGDSTLITDLENALEILRGNLMETQMKLQEAQEENRKYINEKELTMNSSMADTQNIRQLKLQLDEAKRNLQSTSESLNRQMENYRALEAKRLEEHERTVDLLSQNQSLQQEIEVINQDNLRVLLAERSKYYAQLTDFGNQMKAYYEDVMDEKDTSNKRKFEVLVGQLDAYKVELESSNATNENLQVMLKESYNALDDAEEQGKGKGKGKGKGRTRAAAATSSATASDGLTTQKDLKKRKKGKGPMDYEVEIPNEDGSQTFVGFESPTPSDGRRVQLTEIVNTKRTRINK